MQSKGAIRFVAILLALACIWQLMFTVVTKIHENKAVKYAENAAEAFMASPAYEKIPDVDKAYVLDSIKKDQNRWYLDSISSQKVYFGYTFDDVREKEINLGLDLKGGMNVMLQVQVEDVVQALAENNTDPAYVKDEVVRHGRFTGSGETLAFVDHVMGKYHSYCRVVN